MKRRASCTGSDTAGRWVGVNLREDHRWFEIQTLNGLKCLEISSKSSSEYTRSLDVKLQIQTLNFT